MSLFDIYKQGQGVYARIAVAALLGFFALFGLFELYAAIEGWEAVFVGPVQWKLVVVAVLGVLAAIAVALVINSPKAVDFLIVTEAEMRKVSWPSGKQLRQQSLVVIVTCVILSLIIFLADTLFGWIALRIYLN